MQPLGVPLTVSDFLLWIGHRGLESASEVIRTFSPDGKEFRVTRTPDDGIDMRLEVVNDLNIYHLTRRDARGATTPLRLVIGRADAFARLIITDPTDLALVCPRLFAPTAERPQALIPALALCGFIVGREIRQERRERRHRMSRAAHELTDSLSHRMDQTSIDAIRVLFCLEYAMSCDQPTPWSEASAREILFRCERQIIPYRRNEPGERVSTVWTAPTTVRPIVRHDVMARGLEWRESDDPNGPPQYLVQIGRRVFTGDVARRLLTIGQRDY